MKEKCFFKNKNETHPFGGSLLVRKRKSKRPLSTRKPIHLVFRANSSRYFSPRDLHLKRIIHSAAERYKIKISSFAINWNHFHFLIKMESRESYNKFVRYLAAEIVRHLSNKYKKSLEGLFVLRPFTRIVSWGKDFQNVCKYILANVGESFGYGEDMLTYSPLHWRAGSG
jgi:REP element-mobilizing transposase RayT